MTNPILSIIIISYNTRDMTLACLASVYAQTQTPFEVIVVDNAFHDWSILKPELLAELIIEHLPALLESNSADKAYPQK